MTCEAHTKVMVFKDDNESVVAMVRVYAMNHRWLEHVRIWRPASLLDPVVGQAEDDARTRRC